MTSGLLPGKDRFAGDRGEPDPAVLAALQAVAHAQPADVTAAEERLLAGWAEGRVLVPLVPMPRAGDLDVRGPAMATALLTGPDGSRALPVFTGTAALAIWDERARPVPMTVRDAAVTALDDGCAVMVVDLGAPVSIVLRWSQLCALASGEQWCPPHRDPIVARAVREAARQVAGVSRVEVADGSDHVPGAIRLSVWLAPGLSSSEVEGAVAGVGEALAGDPQVRCRLDEVVVTVRSVGPGAVDPGM
ncbi:hypothetical protein KEM60_00568 [Austwickia sp. TVS 96-490-7B]|uniref:SseB family protein n=1 Tax=Austwickia sp. TVS 96-490-7B TaxID=2830843 RepID=UPI001C595EFC|nr:SseB family protein [Austwickia sp. TVS 96-490-7B]MBW3084381.1 hypothetical protein [Austwickia sp. TVS 96-490-7B]